MTSGGRAAKTVLKTSAGESGLGVPEAKPVMSVSADTMAGGGVVAVLVWRVRRMAGRSMRGGWEWKRAPSREYERRAHNGLVREVTCCQLTG